MKKLASLLLVLAVFLSLGTVALAADTTSTQSTKLTTTVPAATYTLNIPADQEIEFGTERTNIGSVTVTDSSGFAVGKNVEVTITTEPFTSETTSTSVPFGLNYASKDDNTLKGMSSYGNKITFDGQVGGGVAQNAHINGETFVIDHLTVGINSDKWGKLLAGDYTAKIYFSSAVVVVTEK